MLNFQNSSFPTLHRKQSCGWQSHVSRSVLDAGFAAPFEFHQFKVPVELGLRTA